MLRVSAALGNDQHLDGGAMFGNAPRAVWQRWCPPDDQGRIELACRCFLVDDGKRKILVEAGVGAFFEPKLRERYGVVQGEHRLLRSLEALGVAPQDVDVVLLSHLHFDHAGGLLRAYREGRAHELCFPQAEYLVGQVAWERACHPHPRDRASFIPELVQLLEATRRVHLVAESETRHSVLGEKIHLRFSHGHTPGMMLPTFEGDVHSATFCADLVPGVPWVHVPITMGYDRFPEQLVDEKRELYQELGDGAWLLFTHDRKVAAGRLAADGAGKFTLEEQKGDFVDWDLDASPH
jgi:glyoxylase-like metal-dependent hydrolase (beta-lactamase superfamily II)